MPQPHATPAPNVLLVEDDLHLAQWAATTLQSRRADLRVLVTPGLSSARRAWAEHPGDWRLAIVDLNLGPDQGATLIREIARQSPELPVLVLTSVDTPDKAIHDGDSRVEPHRLPVCPPGSGSRPCHA